MVSELESIATREDAEVLCLDDEVALLLDRRDAALTEKEAALSAATRIRALIG